MSRKYGIHVRVWRGLYWHHAIFVGNGTVIHYSGLTKTKATATIRVDRYEKFAAGGKVEVVGYARAYDGDEVVRRAQSRVGENGYDAFGNNCEHFARWCMTGEQKSEQITKASAGALGVGGGAALAAGSVGAVVAGGEVAGLAGGAAIMRGLAATGAKVGMRSAGGLALLTIAPAAAATFAVRRAFKDDAMLPQDERNARTAARVTAGATGVLGVAGSVALVSAAGVPGLSAVGITTGLAAIGGAVGGGMTAGVAVVLAGPALLVGLLGYLAYRLARA